MLQLNFDEVIAALNGQRWAVLKSVRREFIVPDVSDKLILPVTPQVCLVAREGYRIADDSRVAAMNTEAIRRSEKYYFARSPFLQSRRC